MKYANLLILADHLEALSVKRSKKIYLGSWLKGKNTTLKPEVLKSPSRTQKGFGYLKEGFCGSVACVAGHATSCPALREQGLAMVYRYWENHTPESAAKYISPSDFYVALIDKNNNVIKETFSALSAVFNVDVDTASLIFGADDATRNFYTGDPDKDPTLKQAAKRLRKYVKECQPDDGLTA